MHNLVDNHLTRPPTERTRGCREIEGKEKVEISIDLYVLGKR